MSDDATPKRIRSGPGHQDPKSGKFVKGNSAGGRKKGSRHKLGENFLDCLFRDWEQHGAKAITKARETDPVSYVKVVASLLPKEIDVRDRSFEDLTDDDVADGLAAILALRKARRARGEAEGGAEVSEEPDEPDRVH